jgi:hypothetical protein
MSCQCLNSFEQDQTQKITDNYTFGAAISWRLLFALTVRIVASAVGVGIMIRFFVDI